MILILKVSRNPPRDVDQFRVLKGAIYMEKGLWGPQADGGQVVSGVCERELTI